MQQLFNVSQFKYPFNKGYILSGIFYSLLLLLCFQTGYCQTWTPTINGQLHLSLSDGTGWGEGISNRRPTSAVGQWGDQYGVALFTNGITRCVIDQSGKTVFGNDVQWDSPGDRVEIKNGNLLVRGDGTSTSMVRLANAGELRLLYKYNTTHKIGFADGDNSWLSYAEYDTKNWIIPAGNVGIGTTNPQTTLDVKGAGMFRNGNTLYSASKSQIFFGYDGTSDYAHAIKSRHNSGSRPGNAIDFYLWKQGSDAVSVMTPTQHVMTLEGDGTVGIGTTAPQTKLHLVTKGTRSAAGSVITYDAGTPYAPLLRSSFQISNSSNSTSSAYDGQFGIRLFGTPSTDYPYLQIATMQDDVPIMMQVGGKPTMQIFQNQVLIGSNLPYPSSGAVIPYSGMNYTLGVRGRIVSSGITCKDLSQWADYVFDDSYELKPLDEVSEYIAENKHLPDVPSAKEVIEKGLDVSDMLKIQMQKIEELTLYTIEQQKQLKAQQQQINELRRQVAPSR